MSNQGTPATDNGVQVSQSSNKKSSKRQGQATQQATQQATHEQSGEYSGDYLDLQAVAQALGVSAFLGKPYDETELLELLRSLTRRSQAAG